MSSPSDSTRLGQLLLYQGRKARWLADRTGYDESTVSRFLSGKQPMSADFVRLAAGLLGVPAEWLAEEEPADVA